MGEQPVESGAQELRAARGHLEETADLLRQALAADEALAGTEAAPTIAEEPPAESGESSGRGAGSGEQA